MAIRALLCGAALAGVVAAAGFASAADMPLKAAPQPVVATPSWTGFYVGGSLGARWDQNDWTTVSRGEAPGPPLAISNNPVSFSQTSFRYGVYGGFNWQFAPRAVAGIEGDFAWASTSGVANGIPGVTPTATSRRPGSWSGPTRP